jgi:hypothetical protein
MPFNMLVLNVETESDGLNGGVGGGMDTKLRADDGCDDVDA